MSSDPQARVALALSEIRLPQHLLDQVFGKGDETAPLNLEEAAMAAIAGAYESVDLPVPDHQGLYYDAVDLIREAMLVWLEEGTSFGPPKTPRH